MPQQAVGAARTEVPAPVGNDLTAQLSRYRQKAVELYREVRRQGQYPCTLRSIPARWEGCARYRWSGRRSCKRGNACPAGQ